jgi:hypothetical protein
MLWFCAFAWTIAIELPIYAVLLRRRWWLVFVVNAITHPLLWFAFPRFEPYWRYVVVAELCVVVVEAIVIAAVTRRVRLAVAASIVANAVSALVGFAILAILV